MLLSTGVNVHTVNASSSLTETNVTSRIPSPQYDTRPDDARTTRTSSSIPLMQNEPSIAINPKKTTNIIVGYNDFSMLSTIHLPRPHWSYSTDGGATWTAGAATLPSGGTDAALCCDTALAFDGNGNAYMATMTFGNQILLYVSQPDGSGNAGATWNGPYIVANTNGIDKPAIAVDRTKGGHNGNIYIAWVDYFAGSSATCPGDGSSTQNDRILVRTATLGGGVPAFSGAAVQASDPASHFNWGPAITVSSSGSLYVAYLRMPDICIRDANTVMISRSDNGGVTFALRGQVVDSGLIPPPGTFPYGALDSYGDRVNAFPAIATTSNGTVFVAWTDSGAGNMDIQSRASLTSGASWNPRVRVNDITTNDQYTPGAASLGSTVYVFYYSRQSDMPNLRGGLYVAVSSNGGGAFAASSAFSSSFSDPRVCSSGWTPCLWGDYIGAAAARTSFSSSEACAVWGDSRDSASTGDNDVNTYFKCIYNDVIYAVSSFWWLVVRPPVYAYIPFNICIIQPQACIVHWQAEILPTQLTSGPMSVSLMADKLPSGVTVKFSQGTGYPPFNSTIDVDFSKAQCSDPTSCLQSIMITASDGTNSTEIGTNEVLSQVPYLVTDTNVYNPGETVNLTGFGFTPTSTATVKLDGNTVGSPSTGTDGSFNLPVILPTSIFNGTHILTATDAQSKSASMTFFTPKVEVESVTGIKPPPPTSPTTTELSPLTIMLLTITIGVIAALPLSRRAKRSA